MSNDKPYQYNVSTTELAGWVHPEREVSDE